MKLGEFIDGLNILRPYYKDGDGYHIGAEHDVFYAYKTERPLSDEDVKKMVELGWFQEDGIHEGEGEYSPDEGWSAFT